MTYVPESVPPPSQPYTLTVIDEQSRTHTIPIDPANLPDSGHGQPGCVLEALLAAHIPIDHACGGVCACSTCHIIVEQGFASCPPATEAEEDMLDLAYGLTPQSRLACQCVPDGSTDVTVRIPSWNRNQVSEGA